MFKSTNYTSDGLISSSKGVLNKNSFDLEKSWFLINTEGKIEALKLYTTLVEESIA
jgi:hypothetical protein